MLTSRVLAVLYESIGRQRPAIQHVAGMIAQELPPEVDVPGRREPGELPELVSEVGLVEVAGAGRDIGPDDRFGRSSASPAAAKR